MDLPPKLPVKGPFKRLYQWLNELRDYAASLRPIDSFGVTTSRSAIGTTRTVNKKESTDAGGDVPRWG